MDMERAAAELARELDVVLGYLFGSAARGRADALSDVDFAVLLDHGLSPEARVDIQLRLMGALAECSAREVQVVVLNEAPPLLAYQVVEEVCCFTRGVKPTTPNSSRASRLFRLEALGRAPHRRARSRHQDGRIEWTGTTL